MQGFNILGLNIHDKNLHKESTEDLVSKILEGADSNFNSFKEAKEYIDAALLGYTPGEGVNLSNYLTKTEASSIYQEKGEYLTEHLDISSKQDKLTLTLLDKINNAITDISGKLDSLTTLQLAVINGSWLPVGNYLTEEQYTGTYSKPEGGIPTSDLAEGVIPTSLPASDVKDWAKADTKPTYTAEEVGALPSTTIIPAAQVQSDWEATEGMGAILNKPEICTNEQVATLYSILEGRIAALEASLGTSTSKAYFAIISGTTSTYKANLKSYAGNFTELTNKETIINSDDEAGMIVVLYNNWIPEFSAYDENLQTWGTPVKLNSGNTTTGYTKTVDGTDYVLWYNTSAVISNNRQFKITLK